jgi:hypothetical protein
MRLWFYILLPQKMEAPNEKNKPKYNIVDVLLIFRIILLPTLNINKKIMFIK